MTATEAAPGAAGAPPSAVYAAGVARGDWQDDPAQHPALVELDRLHAAMIDAGNEGSGVLGRLFGRAPDATVPGLYLWGGVGRGKTFLVDLFYGTVPLPEKRRTHFHRFMREVHTNLREHAGERDPLAVIAKQWRRSLRLLVLDEFFVNDIGDAMLLGRLLQQLFAQGTILVTTSNSAPEALYQHGLQRARFEPAIELIQRHCKVLQLVSDTDYRLRALTRSPVYRAPLDAQSDAWLEQRWRELSGDTGQREGEIEIEGRRIPVRARSEGMAWFDFDTLCAGPRSATDYIEIAREFHTVLVGDIPRLDDERKDAARRLVTLIDELYDRHVNLVCSADAAPMDLYTGTALVGAFERTASRLIEMQSTDYLARGHQL